MPPCASGCLARRRAGVRHDRRRRRGAPDRQRAVDHRVAAAARRHPAAQRGRLAARRSTSTRRSPSTRSSTPACRSTSSKASTGGSGRTASSAASSASPSPCRSSLSGDGQAARQASRSKCLGVLALGGLQGAHRLVHGEVGARRPHRRQPVPAGAAPLTALLDPGAARVARARSSTAMRARSASAPSRAASGARRSRCSRSSSCSRGSARSSPD